MADVGGHAGASSAVLTAAALAFDESAVSEALQRVEEANKQARDEYPSVPHDRVLSELATAKFLVLRRAVTALADAVDAELRGFPARLATLESSATHARARNR